MAEKKGKGRIYEFDPQIYPTRLWVARKGVTIDEIDKMFEAICSDNITGCSFKENHTLPGIGTGAETFVVGHKKSGFMGCLVYLNSPREAKYLSHEADHCADHLFETIGEKERSYNHGEPYAYYQSWVFDCLYKVWRNKV